MSDCDGDVEQRELGDRHGRRRMFLVGLGLFAASSAVGALAGSGRVLIAAQAVQGAGAALLAPLSLSLVSGAFGRERLQGAIGLWAGVSGVGIAIGPLVGGLLVDTSAAIASSGCTCRCAHWRRRSPCAASARPGTPTCDRSTCQAPPRSQPAWVRWSPG